MPRVLSRLSLVLAVVVAAAACGTLEPPSKPAGTHAGRPSTAAPTTGAHAASTRTGRHRPAPPPPSARRHRAAAGTALAALAELPVKGRAPMTGYDRDRFGPAWLDADRNGCDTRNDLLARDLTGVTLEPGTHDCVVTSGDLADPYTASTIHFVKGAGDLVDIDHVVALGNAWVTGAFRWDIHKRAALANDPMNLLAVDAGANRQKGDGDAATWLPADKRFRCAYVARQIGVKAKYGLWVTPAEEQAMRRVLARCPDQPVARDSGTPTRVTNNITDPGDPSSTPHTIHLKGRAGADPRFDYCYEAKAKGYGPYYRGKDPEYSWYADTDGDGVVCE